MFDWLVSLISAGDFMTALLVQVGSWASLGGSEAAADFLKVKQQAETSLLSTETMETCTEAKEQEADTWNEMGRGDQVEVWKI